MAESPAHKFGQLIGNLVEEGMESTLKDIAEKHNLYLDKKQERSARGNRKALKWVDHLGNAHDLDYVLEENGSDQEFGMPIAFIESAWRRYTKHSRNKAQEIQGAVKPLVHTYWRNAPFAGAIIAGDFTDGAIEQLEAQGFEVLYFEQEDVVEAFSAVGIDGHYEEGTPEDDFREKLRNWESKDQSEKDKVIEGLIEANKEDVNQFAKNLENKIERTIRSVLVTPLYGNTESLDDVSEAIKFLREYIQEYGSGELKKYEISVRYNNGDQIDAQFERIEDAIDFLHPYQQAPLSPVRYEEGGGQKDS